MNIIETFIKLISLHSAINYSYYKIIKPKDFSISKIIIMFLLVVLISFMQSIFTLPFILKIILICLFYSILLGKIFNITLEKSFISAILSISIAFATSMLSSIITFTAFSKLTKLYYTNIIIVICTSFLSIIFTVLLFKFKKLKYGLPFIRNQHISENYFGIFILVLNAIIIFTYFLIGSYSNIPIQYLIFGVILFALLMIMVIQKTFILYQKQKLQTQALKDYEQELTETKQKLSTALEEKQKLVKSNHEFYHRQEALNKKLDDLIANKKILTNSEFGEDLTYISDRLNTLSNEYVEKTKMLPKLDKTNIQEIDDMLSYMQSECDKNNIELLLKIECDIQHIVENYISISQLETLLGDLIRNAIIAINHCNNEFKSIMLVFGIKESNYEICILDSGIPFETTTLVNLGLQPASTHLDEGGTGIGFITTFETVNSCNASFVINEITNNNYTKSLEIIFDNKNEYVIISKRFKEIEELNNTNRKIILRG